MYGIYCTLRGQTSGDQGRGTLEAYASVMAMTRDWAISEGGLNSHTRKGNVATIEGTKLREVVIVEGTTACLIPRDVETLVTLLSRFSG